jgi:hypothetical protein
LCVLTLHRDGKLRRTTLGAPSQPSVIASNRRLDGLWLVSQDSQPAVLTVTHDGDLAEVLSVADGHPLLLPAISVGKGEMLAAASIGDRIMVVIEDQDHDQPDVVGSHEVAVWDLHGGVPYGSPFLTEQHFPDRQREVWAATLSAREGRAVMLAGSAGGGPAFVWGSSEMSQPQDRVSR